MGLLYCIRFAIEYCDRILGPKGNDLPALSRFLMFGVPARNRTSNRSLEGSCYIHLTTGTRKMIEN